MGFQDLDSSIGFSIRFHYKIPALRFGVRFQDVDFSIGVQYWIPVLVSSIGFEFQYWIPVLDSKLVFSTGFQC